MEKKKIWFVSIFVIILILLMPSISAINYKTVENNEFLDDIKHPILYEIVHFIYSHRELRLNRILDIAVESGFMYFEVRFPILFIWAMWLGISSMFWLSFWKNASDNLNWGWFEDY